MRAAMRYLFPFIFTGIGFCLPIDGPKPASPKGEMVQLENGLKVLLRPIQGAKDTALVMLFSIGGDHDPPNRSGLGHLVEHLYVTAAAGKATSRTANELIQHYPKGWNAQTGDRYTVIATVFPGSELQTELQDAAARMADLRITESDLEREKPRVVEELANMFGRIPSLGASNRARELIRPTPHQGRKGGLPAQVQSISLSEVHDHWRNYYKPKNAILVLAGAFESAEARKSVTSVFSKIAPGKAAPSPAEPDISTWGELLEVTEKPLPGLTDSEICLAYRAPAPTSEIYAPFLVLMGRLWASAAKLQNNPGQMPVRFAPLDDPEVIFVGSSLRKGENSKQAEERLLAFVAEAIKPKFDVKEIGPLKSQFGFFLGFADQPDSMLASNPYGVAFSLGRRRQLGINSDKLKKSLEQLTEQELRQAAQKVFNPDRHSAAIVRIK
jgi:zinc protease